MRISTNTIYDLGVSAIQLQEAQLLKTQQQAASGRRILAPSDDPIASSQALNVQQASALNTQYRTNRDQAASRLSLGETTVASVADLIHNVRDLAVSAGNGTYTDADRVTLAQTFDQRFQELLALANTTDGNGQYLFSGYRTDMQPFAMGVSGVQYLGDDGARALQVSATRQIGTSFSGSDVFQRIRNGNGAFAATANSANVGSGLVGPGTVLDRAKWDASSGNFTVKFSQNATLTPGAANTGGATATGGIVDQTAWNAGTKDYTIVFTAPGAYNVTDTATGTVIQSGAYTSGATISFNGAQVVISNGGTGPAAGDKFRIVPSVPSGLTYDIIDNGTGKSALTNAVPGAPPYARAYTDGAAISFKSQGSEPAFDYGVQVVLQGTPGAGDQFAVKTSTNQDLFKTISDLAAVLRAGTTGIAGRTKFGNGLSLALINLDQALDHMLVKRSEVGAGLSEIDALNTAGDDLGVQYQQRLSQLQDVDYAAVATELTREQALLQAAQKSFVTVTGKSLFDYL